MDLALREALVRAIQGHAGVTDVVADLEMSATGEGTIAYNTDKLWIDPSAPGFVSGRTRIGDEELVRAYLLLRLTQELGYDADGKRVELERTYRTVGRPGQGKGGRVDVLVRGSKTKPGSDAAFLFIECKAPDKFDSDLRYLDGQLFRLSRQESARPRYLVYYTVELKAGALRERLILIDTTTYPDYAAWDAAGQPITDAIPGAYGIATKRLYGHVTDESSGLRPLDVEASAEQFSRLRNELHDVIWGGGGTNNNEVFVLITRLILAKIYDEKETDPGSAYAFQRRGTAVAPESAQALVGRLNKLYKDAEDGYLALRQPSPGPAFDTSRVSAEKIAYVVGRLESISVTENHHRGDILGEFFEQIVAQDFTQTKGQFFTPVKVIRFMLELVSAVDQTRATISSGRDHLGRPRLPYVVDPSAGSGSFLIEYMKLIRERIGSSQVAKQLPRRVAEAHGTWFSGPTGNAWAEHFLFGVENNYDLGLAAKVNMVLHGDGSANTWIASGLLPFEEYWVEQRHNVLGTVVEPGEHPYKAARNEQFDLILSNPPFSIKLAPDEKQKIEGAFDLMKKAQSEAIFIERWYQLLREGGRFCCILPEAVLDTATAERMRLFLLQYFEIEAVVSLPYDAFRPFTSTKTSILMARKRTSAEVASFRTTIFEVGKASPELTELERLQEAFRRLEWDKRRIFMAEPTTIGYKRRKNLPDLDLPNELYVEGPDGTVDPGSSNTQSNVLGAYRAGPSTSDDSVFGFWVSLRDVASREGLRLDPKYRWLWDRMGGVAKGQPHGSVRLSSWLQLVKLPKMSKGDLATETRLIDLDAVESRQALLRSDVPIVDTIGSDKIRFEGCDLALSRLEPYLGKVLIQPAETDIGTTEWVGLQVKDGMPVLLAAYLLMQPAMCEAFRRLQSGKRHARLDPEELLTLRWQLPPADTWDHLVAEAQSKRDEILRLRSMALSVRGDIDVLLNGGATPTTAAVEHDLTS